MQQRPLGTTDLIVSEVGLGTWQFSGNRWGAKDDAESMRALQTALDTGVNYIDTAAGYGEGRSERLIGQVLRERGDHTTIVSTKVLPKARQWAPPPEKGIDAFFPPQWIIEQCEESLQRLQRDWIDVLFLHTWNLSWGHNSEWFSSMLKLKEQGKIRAIGISVGDERAAEANVHIALGHVDVIQCVYNIFEQEPEYTLFPLAQKYGVGIVARCPFSSGVLTGTWKPGMTFPANDWRGSWPARVGKPNWVEEQLAMADAIAPIIAEEGQGLADAALRFTLMHPAVSSVIPGSANPAHVRANSAAADMPALSDTAMRALKELWLKRIIHGTYNGSI